jgi:hypothetical protein
VFRVVVVCRCAVYPLLLQWYPYRSAYAVRILMLYDYCRAPGGRG